MFDTIWWISASVLFIGCAVQTALGFGMAIIAAPIIVIFRPEWVPAILTIIAFFVSGQNALSQRVHIQWQSILPPMISRIPGTFIGAWILTQVPAQGLQLMVAGMVFIAIFITAFAKPFAATRRNLSVAGFISGFTGSTTSIGGPPMALVMQHGKSHNTRANLSVYFTYGCVLSLASYQLLGIMTADIWLAGLSFIPVAIAGYIVGSFGRGWVDSRFRPILLVICSISALVALYGALTH